jgi:hypothetical protein
MAFLTQNKAKFWKKLIITFVFEKNANFFAENWEKSQKIVIITSTPEVTIIGLKIFVITNVFALKIFGSTLNDYLFRH